MKKSLSAVALSMAILFAVNPTVAVKQAEVHANCCLCMCRAKDETKCSRMCVRLQHSRRIIEEPEMNMCTAECKHVHVVELQ